MSYEGYTQHLCKNGHLISEDCYDEVPTSCPVCGEPFVWHHNVDLTNGSFADEPHTQPYPLVEKGFEDVWHTDHYGNRYATKRTLYEIPDKR